MATRQAPCCLLLLLLLLNPPWRLSKTRPSRLNGKTISNIKFRFLTFDNVPFRVIPSPRGSTSTGPYITLLPVIPLHRPTSPMYQSYPAFCIPSRNTHSAIVPLARLHRRENSRSRSSNTSEDRPSQMVSITTNTNDQHPVASPPPPAISNIPTHPPPPPSLLQSPTSLSTRPLLPFPPDQNRPLPTSATTSLLSVLHLLRPARQKI